MSSAAPRSPRESYHHGNLRNALIAQGRLELERMGPQELSLRNLARAVGVSEAAPSRHFAGKAGLLAAIAADGFRELADIRYRVASSGDAPLTVAYRMMDAYVDFAQAHKGLFNLMVGPRIVSRDTYSELSEQSAASFNVFARAVEGYAIECGWKREALPFVVHSAWAMEHGLAALILSERIPRADMPIGVSSIVHFSISMFLHAVAAGSTGLEALLTVTSNARKGWAEAKEGLVG
ncbi:TetR/AcrR family transcriptional regulator [Paraburkholderia fungorum]|uniref:TetR/AcrR family transcriptional regulator n=1 Tax=Paraburkholderia fungorum TaxID=134537 RepID=UPI0038BAEAB3